MSDPGPGVLQEHLDALCSELRAVVSDAEVAGNLVAETWTGFGQAVRLAHARPVLVHVPASIVKLLSYRAVNDPHYWLGEIHCRLHPGWFVALSYDKPGLDDLNAELGLAPMK